MSERDKIKNLIIEIEKEYPVNKWIHNGYYLWPVLRISLYMSLVKREKKVNPNNIYNVPNKILKLIEIVFSLKDIFFINRKKIDKIYAGAPSHCVNYNGYEFNRYFDPLMDSEESSTLYFSKAFNKKGVYKPNRHFLFSPILTILGLKDKLFGGSSSSTNYIQELCEVLLSKGIDVDGLENILKRNVRTVDLSSALFRFLFRIMKPDEVWVLCYYSADMMGMLIAAHKLSISTIDLQHGGQGANHLAYNNWTNVPTIGYEALPNYFYTWDDLSAKAIDGWTKNNNKHSAKVFGNPWVDGWKQKKFQQSTYTFPENIILYSLQPIGEPLEEYMMEAIKETQHKWNWWLRLHPRQMDEKDEIIFRLKKFGVFKAVNIEEASRLPLPEILTHTKVHITKFSGCALEAYQFDIPSIIIDSKGIDIYEKYIEENVKMKVDLTHSSQNLLRSIKNAYA